MDRKGVLSATLAAVVLVFVSACNDATTPTSPTAAPDAALAGRQQFSHPQVDRWFSAVSREALAHAGVVFVDHDEVTNRVVVGVEHGAARATVRGLAARLGVPAEAVVVETTEPFHLAATLRDVVRPTVGGLQIHFGQYLCTLGFNAVSGGQRSFITNSHCTNRQGGTEGTVYYQPTSGAAGASIGTEVDDPAYFRGGGVCPRGKKCRWSDASRAVYTSGTASDGGGIAKTGLGSLTITGTNNISNEGAASVGQTVSKVGRTTGTTTGPVTRTCANIAVSGSNITQLCQDLVNAGVGSGDSGSPVFAGSTLLGILWGGNSSGTTYVFSPISGIERELGPLATN
jgi:hypothetical protein